MLFRRIGGHMFRCAGRRPRPIAARKFSDRKFSACSSSPSPAPGSTAATSTASPLGGVAVELDRIAPRFEISASQVAVLDSPAAFYSTLKSKILNARNRIYLSTLYIGKSEYDFIETLDRALSNNPKLTLSVLTDALRGTRETPDPSCASLLASLIAKHGSDRVEIRMFHTPNLTGWRKKWIPRRFNEGWGLQHMKLYGIDDEIILSGANLSNDYFTNRLDRYHVFSSRELAGYYAGIHHAVCSLSFQVLPDPHSFAGYVLDWASANKGPSPLDDPRDYIVHASRVLNPLIHPSVNKPDTAFDSKRTYVYPLAQFTPLFTPDTSTEYSAVTSILRLLSESSSFSGARWLFTAGYFNIHPVLSSLLISSTTSPSSSPSNQSKHAPPSTTMGTVLTASPWANGFYGSPGVSGMLPAAYTHLSARFLDKVAQAQSHNSIRLKEWRRGTVGQPGGWTYHAKGLWVTLPQEEHPSLTFVGSSNYTKRSYSLDLEVGALVVTGDRGLKERLGAESRWLQEDARGVSREDLERTERKVGWNVRLAMWIVEMVGGAL